MRHVSAYDEEDKPQVLVVRMPRFCRFQSERRHIHLAEGCTVSIWDFGAKVTRETAAKQFEL